MSRHRRRRNARLRKRSIWHARCWREVEAAFARVQRSLLRMTAQGIALQTRMLPGVASAEVNAEDNTKIDVVFEAPRLEFISITVPFE